MLQYLQDLNDPRVTVDLIRAGVVKGGRIDLECALVLLPLLADLLKANVDEPILVAVEALAQLSLIFGPLIRSTRAVAKEMLGVDLSAEARRQRCQAAFEHFASFLPRVKLLASSGGDKGRAAEDLLKAFRDQLALA